MQLNTLEEDTFLGMPKVRAWSIFTLAMPQVKTSEFDASYDPLVIKSKGMLKSTDIDAN